MEAAAVNEKPVKLGDMMVSGAPPAKLIKAAAVIAERPVRRRDGGRGGYGDRDRGPRRERESSGDGGGDDLGGSRFRKRR